MADETFEVRNIADPQMSFDSLDMTGDIAVDYLDQEPRRVVMRGVRRSEDSTPPPRGTWRGAFGPMEDWIYARVHTSVRDPASGVPDPSLHARKAFVASQMPCPVHRERPLPVAEGSSFLSRYSEGRRYFEGFVCCDRLLAMVRDEVG